MAVKRYRKSEPLGVGLLQAHALRVGALQLNTFGLYFAPLKDSRRAVTVNGGRIPSDKIKGTVLLLLHTDLGEVQYL